MANARKSSWCKTKTGTIPGPGSKPKRTLTLWTPAAIGGVHSVSRHLSAEQIRQQGRNGIQTGGGGGGGPQKGGGGGGPQAGGGGAPHPAGPGGGSHGCALATPAPMPVAAIAMPPHNAVAPRNRRSFTVRVVIVFSPLRRNNTLDASQQ